MVELCTSTGITVWWPISSGDFREDVGRSRGSAQDPHCGQIWLGPTERAEFGGSDQRNSSWSVLDVGPSAAQATRYVGGVDVDIADTGEGAVDRFANDDVKTELFVELASQGFGSELSRLDLPAGELPLARRWSIRCPSTCESATVRPSEYAGDDLDHAFHPA